MKHGACASLCALACWYFHFYDGQKLSVPFEFDEVQLTEAHARKIISFRIFDLRVLQRETDRLNACGSKMLLFYSLMNKTTALLPFRLNILRSTFWYTKKLWHSKNHRKKTAVNKIIQFFSISKKEKWIWFFFSVGLVRFVFIVIELCRGWTPSIIAIVEQSRGTSSSSSSVFLQTRWMKSFIGIHVCN